MAALTNIPNDAKCSVTGYLPMLPVDPISYTAAAPELKAKVFISYSRKDLAFVDRLAAGLEAHQITPTIDRTEIYAFEAWWKRIQTLIAEADTVIFVLSPHAVASDICRKEVEYALSLRKRFAPVVARSVAGEMDKLPATLGDLNFVFFDDPDRFEPALAHLVEALRNDIHWVRKHTQFGLDALAWVNARKANGLLLRSPLLEEAERWVASRPPGAPAPTEDTQTFIVESRRATSRRRNILTVSLAAGFVLAIGLAAFAFWQRSQAEEQRRYAVKQEGVARTQEGIARTQEGIAKQQRDAAEIAKKEAQEQTVRANRERAEAQVSQSHFLIQRAGEARRDANPELATLLALQAIPRPGLPRPFVPEVFPELDEELVEDTIKISLPSAGVSRDAFSEDGKTLVVGAATPNVTVWDVETGRLLAGFPSPAPMSQLLITPKTIVGTTKDNHFLVWSRTGELVRSVSYEVPKDTRFVNAQLSADGTRGAICSSAGTHVFDLVAGKKIDETGDDALASGRTICALSRNGKFLVSWSGNRPDLYLRDLTSGQTRSYKTNGNVSFVTIARDGSMLAAVTASGTDILKTETLEKTATLPPDPHDRGIRTSGLGEFSPDASRFAFARKGVVTLLTTDGKKLGEWDTGIERAILTTLFSADGSILLVFAIDGTYAFETTAMKPLGRWNHAPFSMIAPKPRSAAFAYFGEDGIVIADLSKPFAQKVLDDSQRPLTSIAMSHDGKSLLTGSWDGVARWYDSRSGAKRSEFRATAGFNLLDVSMNPDDTRVLATSSDGFARVWDAATGTLLRTIPGKRGIFVGSRILFTNTDRTYSLWNVDANVLLRSLQMPENPAGLEASADGNAVLVRWFNGETVLINAAKKKVCRFRSPGSKSSATAMLSDGTSFLVRSADSKLQRVDLATCKVSKTSTFSLDATLDDLSVSRRGDRALVKSQFGPAATVDTSTLDIVKTLDDSRQVQRQVMSADGRRVVAELRDGSFVVWDALTGERVATHPPVTTTQMPRMPIVSFDGRHVVFDASTYVRDAPHPGRALLWNVPSNAGLLGWALASQARRLDASERAAYFLPAREFRRIWATDPDPCDALGADVTDPDRTAPGRLHDGRENAPKIIAACEKAVTKEPGRERFRIQLARGLYFTGKDADAIALLQKDGGPHAPFGVYLLGSILSRKADQWPRAYELLKKAADLGLANAHYKLWEVLAPKKDKQVEAERELATAAARGSPRAEETIAERKEKAAAAQPDPEKRRAGYVDAFRHWARSAHLAEMQDWPEEESRFAVARRGSLARFLAHLGMERDEVAAIFSDAIGADFTAAQLKDSKQPKLSATAR